MKSTDNKQIIVFTAPGCSFCKVVISYLRNLKREFQEIDISQDQEANKWLQEQGITGVPVTLFGNKEIVIGWQRAQIDACLDNLK